MSPSIAEANATLRQAVEIRRENQAAGKPLEEWYGVQSETDSFQDVTKPMPFATSDEVSYQQEELTAAIQRFSREAFPRSTVHPTSQAFFDLCDALKEMHRRKSSDYGCPSGTDPLANIRNGAKFVGIPAWKAAMVRLSDKVTRLATFNVTGTLENESVEDNLFDLASYSLLALQLFRESQTE